MVKEAQGVLLHGVLVLPVSVFKPGERVYA